ncbi:MAG: hypothetical protein V4660_15820 [Pseudomonadota bacterium]
MKYTWSVPEVTQTSLMDYGPACLESLAEAKATPSMLITRLPNNMTHFIVVWRSLGRWLQIMDPAHG